MADYPSSLPVRSEADGADERLQSKLVDFTTPSQGMTIDAQGNAHVEVHGDDPAAADKVLRLSELGHATLDGVYDGTNNTDPSQTGLVVHTRNATPGDTHQVIRQTGISNGTVHAADIALHDATGAAFSETNPLPVYIAADPGTEIVNYDTQASLAANASDTHTYAVASGIFELKQVWAAASGKMKIEVVYYDGVSPTTIAVGFNSTANPNISISFPPYVVVGAAGKEIRVIRTNLDNQAQDVYSTVMGELK